MNLESEIKQAEQSIKVNAYRVTLGVPAAAIGIKFIFDVIPHLTDPSIPSLFAGLAPLGLGVLTGTGLLETNIGINNLLKDHARLVAALETKFHNEITSPSNKTTP